MNNTNDKVLVNGIKRAGLLLVLYLSFTTIGCRQEKIEAAIVPEISIEDFISAYHSNPSIKILDVRTEQEYNEGHVKGAVLLPLHILEAEGERAMHPLRFNKDEKIYVICRSGNRSKTAVSKLQSIGYKNSVSVQKGTNGWIRSGRPVE